MTTVPFAESDRVAFTPGESLASREAAPEASSPTILQIVNSILKRRFLIASVAVFASVTTGVTLFFWPDSYTTQASFMPVASQLTASSLSSLAAQFGVTIPTGASGDGPDFYAALITSPSVLLPIVERKYHFTTPDGDTLSGDLVTLFDVDKGDRGKDLDETVRELGKSMTVDADQITGLVTFSVSTEWPALSKQVADLLMNAVDTLNVRVRRQQAITERQFVQERVTESRQQLTDAEQALEEFMLRNRQFATDPQLALTYSRLQRDVTMRQSVYTGLVQAYEQDRIDAVRTTPVIVPVASPTAPLWADRKHIGLFMLAAAIFGALLGALVALFLEFSAELQRESPKEFSEFVALRGRVFSEIRHPIVTTKSLWRRRPRFRKASV